MAKGGQFSIRFGRKNTIVGNKNGNTKKSSRESAIKALQERAKQAMEVKARTIELLAKIGLPELKLIQGDKYNIVLVRLRENQTIPNNEKLELIRTVILSEIHNPATQNVALQRAKIEFK